MTQLFSEVKISSRKNGRKQDRNSSGLDGKTWLQYSISVWNDIRKTADELSLKHPAMFPAALPGRLIETFTREGDTVFDPFAGTGSTLIAASERGRRGIGIEIAPEFISIYKNRLSQMDLFHHDRAAGMVYKDDAKNLTKYVKPNSVQLTVTSPPYWNILNQDRSADGKEIRNYGRNKRNLGNVEDYIEFLQELKEIFADVFKVTKSGGYCCVIVMDIRKKDKYYPFHIDLTRIMAEVEFELDDIIIWDRRQEYNNLRPLGYPFVFRVNKIHEYILIFLKR